MPRSVSKSPSRALAVLSAAVIGLLFAAGASQSYRRNIRAGANDFLQLYAGARLVGSPDLYNPQRVREVQLAAAGTTGRFLVFNRLLPWYAAALRPLARLPYRRAWLVWFLLQAFCFGVFAALWPYPRTLEFSLLSLPAYLSLMEGQDTAIVLACVAVATALYRRGSPCASGAVFSFETGQCACSRCLPDTRTRRWITCPRSRALSRTGQPLGR